MKHDYTIERGALDGVGAFLAVARRRSFRRAAAEIGVTPSAVSQTIRALEAAVGAPLLLRTTRSVGLTEAGERFLEQAAPAFEQLAAARAAARDVAARPTGLLRLAVPRSVVPLILEPVLLSFCRAYPDIELEIAASDEMVDIAREGFDAGIRMGQLIAPDMVAVRLTPPFPFVVVAAPDYLAERGVPQTLGDLSFHAGMRLRRADGSVAPWRFGQDGGPLEVFVRGPLIAHDYPTLVAAAERGLGLTQAPAPVARPAIKASRLVRVLETFEVETPGVFLYYTRRNQVLPKLRVFIEHLRDAG